MKNQEKMKIILKSDALIIHSKETPAHVGYSQHTIDWRKSISDMIEENGLEFEVNTQYLKPNSFLIEREGKGAISIPEYMVAEVINDQRESKPKRKRKL